jgi:hypothetical protein
MRQQILLSLAIQPVPAGDLPIPSGAQQEQRQASISRRRPVKCQYASASAHLTGFLETRRAHGTDLSLPKTPGGAIFALEHPESGKCRL